MDLQTPVWTTMRALKTSCKRPLQQRRFNSVCLSSARQNVVVPPPAVHFVLHGTSQAAQQLSGGRTKRRKKHGRTFQRSKNKIKRRNTRSNKARHSSPRRRTRKTSPNARKKKKKKKSRRGHQTIPYKYLPVQQLSKKDARIQKKQIEHSRREYKKGRYAERKTLKSFRSKQSPHIVRAKKIYKQDVYPSRAYARATQCSIGGLNKIVNKGRAAFYSSGSRPNQTNHSWALARLASATSGGKAFKYDRNILEKYCRPTSPVFRLAKKSKFI